VPVLVHEDLTEQEEHQRRYFDDEFSGYSEYELDSWRLSFIERIFESLGVLDGGEPYLDVGVGGSGATVIEAARRGVQAVGSDLSVEGILTAERFARGEGVEGNASFVVSSADELPFPDGAFGSASAVAVLEHLDDDRPAVGELARVLRPGGRLWLTVPHAFRYMTPPAWPFYWLHDRRIGHKRHYDEKSLVRLGAAFGLEHVRTRYSAHTVKLAQYAGARLFPRMRDPRSRLWWRLEQADRRAESRRYGAMHISVVLRRAAARTG
jgi:ubiquinone/menaquinone biosynthesis C-methylase UbiE